MLLICIVASLLVAGCIEPTAASDKKVIPPTPVPTFSAVPTAAPATAPSLIVATSKVTPIPTPTTSFDEYSNSEYGFSIDYPSDWQRNELNTMEPEISLSRFDVVEFYSPSFLRCNSEKSDCVYVRSEVKIEVDTNPVSTELDTFFVKEVARMSTLSGFEITKRDSMFKLSGTKAYRLDYTSHTDTEEINVLSAYTIQNDMGYIISYHAHAPVRDEKINQFEQYYNDAMSMFSSFKVNAGTYKTI